MEQEEASLAFFQNFYTNVSLYVVPEPGPAAITPPLAVAPLLAVAPPATAAPAPVAPPPPAAPLLPPVAPVPTVVVSAPAPPAPAPAPVAIPIPSGLPSLVAPAAPRPTPPLAPPPAAAAPADAPPQRTAPPLTETPYSTLGSNANGLVILVRLDAVQFQRLPKNVFLNNLLKAIRLVMADVVLINVESHLPVALSTLRRQLAAKQVIGFGKNLLDVAVYKTQLYEPVLLVNDVAYLPAAEIELLEEDNSRKKLLWQAMQRMFLG
ncbi:hypothetical protein [Hymenobacter algoricola]|uniref:Uncharacterized protein n=1 Tax=Hymenobacter algoricola TaxID=486267 RepID=A0ABP7N8E1_9BACT